jgi:trans-2,3-dihydro-3-hydroxyanthranilate isomerase
LRIADRDIPDKPARQAHANTTAGCYALPAAEAMAQEITMTTRELPFWLVDVFASEAFTGNGLSVFLLEAELSSDAMQRITVEMRQFETIFLTRSAQPSTFNARIFTMEEELPFAGHPVIGAAALLHAEFFAAQDSAALEFVIQDRHIKVTSRRQGGSYVAEMDQGRAIIEPPIAAAQNEAFLEALNLATADLAPDLPLQVVSTGLPYLIVPIVSNLDRARIVVPGFEALLATVGAKFVYVLDVNRLEGRTWDNDGRVEDIATGSAAGPAAAYLVNHKRASTGQSFVLSQGRFLKRPSEISVTTQDSSGLKVSISGQVCFVGSGSLNLTGLEDSQCQGQTS